MYLITNWKLCSKEKYFDVISEAVNAGVQNIIIREKDLDDYCLGKLYLEIKKNIADKKKDEINLIINTNINIFEKYDCDGLHLPYRIFLDLLESGYEFKDNKILGLSLHCLDEIKYLEKIIDKENVRVDYITLSHIYKTKCKENIEPKGIDFIKNARKITKIKIVALGGITPLNVEEVMKYSDDFAVMSTVMMSENVAKTVEKYLINK